MNEALDFSLFNDVAEPTLYSAGTPVFKRGDAGNSMFLITSGEVDILVEGRVVERLTKGNIFGEMALVDHQARSADAVARTDSQIIQIDEQLFLMMIDSTPSFALKVMRLMVVRLRQRMADVEQLQTYLGLLQA